MVMSFFCSARRAETGRVQATKRGARMRAEVALARDFSAAPGRDARNRLAGLFDAYGVKTFSLNEATIVASA
jgi:hypothetical protein